MRAAKRDRGGEIIDRLRDDARPIDRIDAGQPHAVAEGVMIEHRLHQRLAIVEGAFDRERVHVCVRRRGHHAPLHFGNAAMREQHHHVHLGAAAERLDRGAAGVARGRHHDGGALAALLQHVVHQPGDQLHGEVLEGERRPMKQLEHEQTWAELRERRGRRVTERAVGLARHAGEIGLRNGGADEGLDHLDRDLGVRLTREAGDRFGIERGPRLRHVKAAVAGEPREHDLDEIERRGLAPS